MKYVKFNKPYDVLCQFTSELGHETLADYRLPHGVYAAGRLDKDSEGLLLLTDDGNMSDRLTNPKYDHEKTYWVQIEKIPTIEDFEKLSLGVMIGDYKTRPCKVRLLTEEPNFPPRKVPIRVRKSIPTCWIEIILTEGKNRQVRRMTAAIGFPTLRLVRVAIGKVNLFDLQPGEWKNIDKSEIQL